MLIVSLIFCADINATESGPNIQEGSEQKFILGKREATGFLSRGKYPHRRRKRGIMDECCHGKSCSWEEYAEYCHTFNRRAADRNSVCTP